MVHFSSTPIGATPDLDMPAHQYCGEHPRDASKTLDFKIILICSGDLQYLLEYIFTVYAAKAPRICALVNV